MCIYIYIYMYNVFLVQKTYRTTSSENLPLTIGCSSNYLS